MDSTMSTDYAPSASRVSPCLSTLLDACEGGVPSSASARALHCACSPSSLSASAFVSSSCEFDHHQHALSNIVLHDQTLRDDVTATDVCTACPSEGDARRTLFLCRVSHPLAFVMRACRFCWIPGATSYPLAFAQRRSFFFPLS